MSEVGIKGCRFVNADRKLLSYDYHWASIRVIVVIHVFIISDCQYHLYKIYHYHNSKGFPIEIIPRTNPTAGRFCDSFDRSDGTMTCAGVGTKNRRTGQES